MKVWVSYIADRKETELLQPYFNERDAMKNIIVKAMKYYDFILFNIRDQLYYFIEDNLYKLKDDVPELKDVTFEVKDLEERLPEFINYTGDLFDYVGEEIAEYLAENTEEFYKMYEKNNNDWWFDLEEKEIK